jgi:hypothetical protein
VIGEIDDESSVVQLNKTMGKSSIFANLIRLFYQSSEINA